MAIRSAKNSPLAVAAIVLLLLTCEHQATATEQPGTQRNIPTTITSDRMDYDAIAQTVVFLGNVYVKRPDFELWAEKMTIYLEKSESGNATAAGMEAGNIERIIAERNVRLKSENNTGTSDKATYFPREDKLVMEGRPVLRDSKQSTVTGRTIIHYVSGNRSQVIGGGTATFYSEDRTQR